MKCYHVTGYFNCWYLRIFPLADDRSTYHMMAGQHMSMGTVLVNSHLLAVQYYRYTHKYMMSWRWDIETDHHRHHHLTRCRHIGSVVFFMHPIWQTASRRPMLAPTSLTMPDMRYIAWDVCMRYIAWDVWHEIYGTREKEKINQMAMIAIWVNLEPLKSVWRPGQSKLNSWFFKTSKSRSQFALNCPLMHHKYLHTERDTYTLFSIRTGMVRVLLRSTVWHQLVMFVCSYFYSFSSSSFYLFLYL